MRKYLIYFSLFTFHFSLLVSCSDYNETVSTNTLTVALQFPDEAEGTKEGIRVELKSIGHEAVFVDSTNAQGIATFEVTPGIYEASSSATRRQGNNSLQILNGNSGQIIVKGDMPQVSASLSLRSSRVSQLVIKELYNGGVMKDDGKNFQADKCFILYNNTSVTASYDDLCVAFCAPYNSQANNNWYGPDGRLVYEAEDYIPVLDGIWHFPGTLVIEPYSQIVVNVHGAIDNTLTYPQSVNYANADYYCMYDPEAGYTNTSYYPTPSEVIPTSHYLKAVKIGIANAWALSVTSPALFIFQTQEATPREFATNIDNMAYIPGAAQTDINKVVKVPVDWILDGIEVFSAAHVSGNQKRLTATVDAGFIYLTNQHGHTLYRNVDREATEAMSENEGLLVYGYTSDPSGIDAEASLRQGAHIVYQDTNNSSNDFHQRETCSLRN